MKVTKKHKTAIVVIERDKSLEHNHVTSGISERAFSSDNNSRNKKLAIHPFFTKFKTTVKKEVVSDQPTNFTVKVLKSIKREAGAASKAVKKKLHGRMILIREVMMTMKIVMLTIRTMMLAT